MTASKAIIEKEYQPKVIISTQDPNPFNKLTDQELEEYRKAVEQKQKGAEGTAETSVVAWLRHLLLSSYNPPSFTCLRIPDLK